MRGPVPADAWNSMPVEIKGKIAIVDYAHNKLSFEKLFSSMKEEYPD